MTDKKQILLAFVIPFFLAVILFVFGYFLQPDCSYTFVDNGNVICGYENYDVPIASEEYILMIFGLIVLSFILPFFVTWRNHQSRKAKVESIIKI